MMYKVGLFFLGDHSKSSILQNIFNSKFQWLISTIEKNLTNIAHCSVNTKRHWFNVLLNTDLKGF